MRCVGKYVKGKLDVWQVPHPSRVRLQPCMCANETCLIFPERGSPNPISSDFFSCLDWAGVVLVKHAWMMDYSEPRTLCRAQCLTKSGIIIFRESEQLFIDEIVVNSYLSFQTEIKSIYFDHNDGRCIRVLCFSLHPQRLLFYQYTYIRPRA